MSFDAKKKYGYDPVEQLAAACGRVVCNSSVSHTAGLGYLQAVMAQAALQGLINALKKKGLLSADEIERALMEGYNDQFKRMSATNGVILTPQPTGKPS